MLHLNMVLCQSTVYLIEIIVLHQPRDLKVAPKSKIKFFLLPDIYQSRLFWCKLKFLGILAAEMSAFSQM